MTLINNLMTPKKGDVAVNDFDDANWTQETANWTQETMEAASHFPFFRLFKQDFENKLSGVAG